MSAPDDDAIIEHYPGFWFYFTRQEWEDKRRSDPCTVTIRLTSGGYQVTLNDPDLCQSKTCFAPTWAEILPELEKLVYDELRPWKAYTKDIKLTKHTKKVQEDA